MLYDDLRERAKADAGGRLDEDGHDIMLYRDDEETDEAFRKRLIAEIDSLEMMITRLH